MYYCFDFILAFMNEKMSIFGFTITCLILCGSIVQAEYWKFEDCSKKDGSGFTEVSAASINPDPVNLRKNMNITMHVKVLRDIPAKAMLKTRYYKIKKFLGVTIDVPIPCLLGKFGSCTFPFCQYVRLFKEQIIPFFPKDVEYGCPVKAGDYGGDDLDIKIPEMGAIARMIVGGKYRTELELTLDGKTTDCYKIWTEMK